jgi:hypothetical protein
VSAPSVSKSPTYLADEIAERLSREAVSYDFRVQFFVDEARTPIEDASVEWPESVSPFETVARLVIPQQDVRSEEGVAREASIERMSFDPWHAPEEFRPLGDVMRARKGAYYVSVKGRNAAGVIGIRLEGGDEVIGSSVLTPDFNVLTITENGYGKLTPEIEFPRHNRGTKGVVLHNITDKTGDVSGLLITSGEGDLLLITSEGTLIRTQVSSIRICGRASQGVIVMRTGGEEKVIGIAATSPEDEDDGEEGAQDDTDDTEESAKEGEEGESEE